MSGIRVLPTIDEAPLQPDETTVTQEPDVEPRRATRRKVSGIPVPPRIVEAPLEPEEETEPKGSPKKSKRTKRRKGRPYKPRLPKTGTSFYNFLKEYRKQHSDVEPEQQLLDGASEWRKLDNKQKYRFRKPNMVPTQEEAKDESEVIPAPKLSAWQSFIRFVTKKKW